VCYSALPVGSTRVTGVFQDAIESQPRNRHPIIFPIRVIRVIRGKNLLHMDLLYLSLDFALHPLRQLLSLTPSLTLSLLPTQLATSVTKTLDNPHPYKIKV
jgi:hypothetical protein